MRPASAHGPVFTRLERTSHTELALPLSPSCSSTTEAQSNNAEGIIWGYCVECSWPLRKAGSEAESQGVGLGHLTQPWWCLFQPALSCAHGHLPLPRTSSRLGPSTFLRVRALDLPPQKWTILRHSSTVMGSVNLGSCLVISTPISWSSVDRPQAQQQW